MEEVFDLIPQLLLLLPPLPPAAAKQPPQLPPPPSVEPSTPKPKPVESVPAVPPDLAALAAAKRKQFVSQPAIWRVVGKDKLGSPSPATRV